MINFSSALSKTQVLSVFAFAVILFSIPAASSASEAAFSKYYRARASSSGNLGCPPGWTQIDSWSIDEGDSADGGGGTHTGLACASSAYKAAFAKYYRTNSSNSFPLCPSGWTAVDTWAVQEGDRGDGGGGWHGGVACASNSYQSAISKYYRERAGSRPQNAWALNVDQCPQGSWAKIDSWSVYEGDGDDGGGGQHDGFACAYTASGYTKTYAKYYRTNRPPDDYPATIPPCAAGWNRIDTWGVWEGDSADGGGNWHTGVACVAPAPPPSTGTVVIKATKTSGGVTTAWNSPPFDVNYTGPSGPITASFDPEQTTPGVPTGTYSVNSVTPPPGAGVTYSSVTPSSQTLSANGTITFTFNFVTIPPSTGTIQVRATKDKDQNGVPIPWNTSFTANMTMPGSPAGDVSVTAPQDFPGSLTGTYTVNKLPNLPAGVTLSSITPSPSQTLTANGTITFTANFATVAVPPLPVPTLVISPSSGASVAVGGTQQFNAIYDPDGSGPLPPQYVTNSSLWSSSSDSIATVSSTGVATGKSAGSATITAQYSGLTASASLTVTALTPTLTVTPSSWSLAVGDSKQFIATYDPDGPGPNPSQDVTGNVNTTWSPSDATKVTISGGLATRVGHGTALITASYSGLSRSATVLDPAVLILIVLPTPNNLNVGDDVQLHAYLDPGETEVTAFSSWSYNKYFATVDASGKVHALSPGNNDRITARYPGVASGYAIVNVAAQPVPALVVSCSASPISATTGQPVVWTATASGGTGSYSYRWSGSSPLGGKTGKSVAVSYPTSGTKTGSVVVTSGSQTSPSTACSNSVEIQNPLPLSVATLTATPSSINKGDSSTLTWASTNNATRCDSDFSTDHSPINTSPGVPVSPIVNTTYSIYCTNADGAVGPTASAAVTVVPVAVSIKASPTCISGGGNSKISWSATPSNLRCDVSGPGLSHPGLTGAQLTGFQNVPISAKSTYTIACTTNGGSTVPSKSAIVDVSGCWSEF